MIIGIGVDSIEIHRFATWHTYSYTQLSRLFSHKEIEYCLMIQNKSAERFAARFAAREAFFKAFTAMQPTHTVPFLTMCKNIAVINHQRNPLLHINWNTLDNIAAQDILHTTHISLTHTQTTATAFVIIEKN